MSTAGVSDALPQYLKSRFTVSNPPVPERRPLKQIKIPLKQGVSSDSPLFFQLSHVSVVNSSVFNREISASVELKDRFLSSLKRNNISTKPKFAYTDSQSGLFDYHSLKPSLVIDLSADKSPKLKDSTRFRQAFYTHLEKGFGKNRGQCTVEAMQPKIPRYLQGQIEVLQNKLQKTKKIEGKYQKTGKKMNSDFKSSPLAPLLYQSKPEKKNYRRTSAPGTLQDLDDFEKEQLVKYSNMQTRQIYSLV